jgi:hypothetical protein
MRSTNYETAHYSPHYVLLKYSGHVNLICNCCYQIKNENEMYTESRGLIVTTPTSYSGGPGFDSLAW